jgi:hypothetical protein
MADWMRKADEMTGELDHYHGEQKELDEESMPRQHHYIKCETEYFQEIEWDRKKFEFRKDDRKYQAHDLVYLEETVNGEKTGRVLDGLKIQYIMRGPAFGLPEGYCVFNW